MVVSQGRPIGRERTASMGRPPSPLSKSLAAMLKETMIALVRSDRRDLSARQLAVFLIV